MPNFETEAIVLKSHNLAEADRITIFLTRDYGIVRAVARGSRRLRSRFGGALEPFTVVQLAYFQKEDRELVSLQSAEMLISSFISASDPHFLRTFSYIAELVLAFVPPNDPNQTLYKMVRACISSGATSERELAAVALYFELWLLRLSGYLPNWVNCGFCAREIDAKDFAGLRSDFALACPACQKPSDAVVISPVLRLVFQSVQRLSPAEFSEFANHQDVTVNQLSSILRRIAAQALGRDVIGEKSLAVRF